MICKHCGKEIQDNEKRCPYCNTPVIRIKVKRICAYCKMEIKKGDKACPGCGRKVPEKIQEILEKDSEESEVGEFLYPETEDTEQSGWRTLDFKLLMLSIFPPLLVIFFQILFAKTGFLPEYLSSVIVYFISSMLISYFLDPLLSEVWMEEKGAKLSDPMRCLFYLCPLYTLYFLLKGRNKTDNPLLFFCVLHLSLVGICFFL